MKFFAVEAAVAGAAGGQKQKLRRTHRVTNTMKHPRPLPYLLCCAIAGLFALSAACSGGSTGQTAGPEAGTYRVSLALRQNSQTCPAGAGAAALEPFRAQPTHVKVDDGKDGTKVIALCTGSISSCEYAGELKLDTTYSPAAWVGETRTAQRVDEQTCRMRLASFSIVTVKLSNFASPDRVRYLRTIYEADYPVPGGPSGTCRPDNYQGQIACKYEEVIEAAPEQQ